MKEEITSIRVTEWKELEKMTEKEKDKVLLNLGRTYGSYTIVPCSVEITKINWEDVEK